jgi:hypothetical protein
VEERFKTKIETMIQEQFVRDLLKAAYPAKKVNTIEAVQFQFNLASAATKEVASLQITASASADGNVTVTLDGIATDVAVALNDTPAAVADKIRATAFAGWTTGGTAGTDTVTFTANETGPKADATYSAGGTGAAGTMTTTTQGDSDTSEGRSIANGLFIGDLHLSNQGSAYAGNLTLTLSDSVKGGSIDTIYKYGNPSLSLPGAAFTDLAATYLGQEPEGLKLANILFTGYKVSFL